MSFLSLPRVSTSAGPGLRAGPPSSAANLPVAVSWLLKSKHPSESQTQSTRGWLGK